MMAWLTRILRGPTPPTDPPATPPLPEPRTCPKATPSPAERRLAVATAHANRKIEEAEAATLDVATVLRRARQRHQEGFQ